VSSVVNGLSEFARSEANSMKMKRRFVNKTADIDEDTFADLLRQAVRRSS
jgi:hypothetical protein